MTERTIFALGFFDGVHLGHQALLRACRDLADSHGLVAGAVTFDSHPLALLGEEAPKLINTPADRRKLLEQFGMERVISLPFDKQMMATPWQDFLARLMTEYNAAGFVCGDDFRFGAGGEGTAHLLKQACEERGLPCRVVSQQTVDGVRVSSTHIRGLLEQGRMEEAVRFLGHPHILSGTVVRGRQLGRTIGIPTANLEIPEAVAVPKFGVYACKVGAHMAVTNVGNRPTVGGHHTTVEPWILDFAGDLYGKAITVEFYRFLRPEKNFPSLEDLRREIEKNGRETREFFAEM